MSIEKQLKSHIIRHISKLPYCFVVSNFLFIFSNFFLEVWVTSGVVTFAMEIESVDIGEGRNWKEVSR